MRPPRHLTQHLASDPSASQLIQAKQLVDKLPPTALKELLAYVQGTLASKSTAGEDRYEELVYRILVEWLRAHHRAESAPFASFRQHPEYARFRASCKSIEAFVSATFGTSLQKSAYETLLRLLVASAGARVAAVYLVANRSAVVKLLSDPASVFDSAFPGYLRNGAAAVALQAWERASGAPY